MARASKHEIALRAELASVREEIAATERQLDELMATRAGLIAVSTRLDRILDTANEQENAE